MSTYGEAGVEKLLELLQVGKHIADGDKIIIVCVCVWEIV
jgi:hypothetical protein